MTSFLVSSFQASKRGRMPPICIDRPKVVEYYNQYMGGVDLADMRRLHCNSTIMGQNRWWLKLFFYLLDVGTSNALVLYKEATKPNNAKMSIVEFKSILVESFVGNKLGLAPERNLELAHTLIQIGNDTRRICAYCALFGETNKRTRYRCSHPDCMIPLCSPASGQAPVDCFTECHANESIRKATFKKYEAMKKKTNHKCKDSN
jgi:hypothetical protein